MCLALIVLAGVRSRTGPSRMREFGFGFFCLFLLVCVFLNLCRLSQILRVSLIPSTSLVCIFGTLEVLVLQNFNLFFLFYYFKQVGKGLLCVLSEEDQSDPHLKVYQLISAVT